MRGSSVAPKNSLGAASQNSLPGSVNSRNASRSRAGNAHKKKRTTMLNGRNAEQVLKQLKEKEVPSPTKKNSTVDKKITRKLTFIKHQEKRHASHKCLQIINPENSALRTFQMVLAIAIVWSAIIVPVDISLGTDRSANQSIYSPTTVADLIIDCVFLIDVVLNFRIGYFDEDGELVMTPRRVARNYFCTWFIPDMAASIPLEIMEVVALEVQGTGGLTSELKFLKTLKLFRLLRFGRMSVALMSFSFGPIFRILRLFMIFTLLIHWFACAWFWIEEKQNFTGWSVGGLVDISDGSNATRVEKYTLCLYWAATTLTTVGYGDMSPVTWNEQVYTICVMLVGAIMFAWVFGEITNVITDSDAANRKYMEKIEILQLFLKAQHIPVALQKRIFQYYNFVWDRKKSFAQHSIMDELPLSLYYEVAEVIHKRMFSHSLVWAHCPKTYMQLIMGKLHEADTVVYLPLDCIFFENDEIEFIYLIEKGLVTLYKDDLPMQQRCDGSYLGDIGLVDHPEDEVEEAEKNNEELSWGNHFVTARATSYCDVHLLFIHELMDLITQDEDVELFKELLHIASDRRKSKVEKLMQKVNELTPDSTDVPTVETPDEDDDVLRLAIAFWQRRHQVNSMCQTMEKEEEDRRAQEVKDRIARRSGKTIAQRVAANAKKKAFKLKDVSQMVLANVLLQKGLDEKRRDEDSGLTKTKRRKRRKRSLAKAVPFGKTTKVSQSKFALHDLTATFSGSSARRSFEPSKYLQTISSKARRLNRGVRGFGNVAKAAGEIKNPYAQTVSQHKRRKSAHRAMRRQDAFEGLREGDGERFEQLEDEMRDMRQGFDQKFDQLSKNLADLGTLVRDAVVATRSPKKSKEKKKKKGDKS